MQTPDRNESFPRRWSRGVSYFAVSVSFGLVVGGMMHVKRVEAQEKQAQSISPAPVRSFPATVARRRIEQAANADPVDQAKVVGGIPAKKGQFRWQVGIIRSHAPMDDPFHGFFCGASLVGWRWVLTAAHCTYEDDLSGLPMEMAADRIHVYLGSHDFKGGQRMPVKSVWRHKPYDPLRDDNDIALLELDTEPQDKRELELLPLIKASDDAPLEPGKTARVLGWGSMGKGIIPQHLRESVRILQYAEMQFKPSNECNQHHVNDRRANRGRALKAQGKSDSEIRFMLDEVYPPDKQLVTDNMICAGTDDASKDACFGDSGGPLVVFRRDGIVQAGIVSWGPANGCGLTNLYGVYVRLPRYLNWIQSKIN